jgi:dipeptidyl aminopeptidase/acylaminoacyl peptidase
MSMSSFACNARSVAAVVLLLATAAAACGGEAGAEQVRVLESISLARAQAVPYSLEDVSPSGREFLVRVSSAKEHTCAKLLLISVDGDAKVLSDSVSPLEGIYGGYALFSPRGDRVAYLASASCDIEDRGADLTVVSVGGHSSATLVGSFLGVRAWTSDDRIIVSSEHEDASSVWEVRADFSGSKELGSRSLLEVSTDGRTSVYLNQRSRLVFERAEQEAIEVAGGWINPEGFLSPDGRYYLYLPFRAVFDGWAIFDVERKVETAVRLPEDAQTGANITSAEWSPDGRILIMETERPPGFEEGIANRHQAYVLNADGSDFRLLSGTGFGFAMVWRPPLLFYRREDRIVVSVISRGAVDERAANEMLALIRDSFPEPISLEFASAR